MYCWFQWDNSCRFIHICMHGWKLSTLVEAMAIYVYGGVRREARVWELSMNLFSATGEFVLDATMNLLLRLSVQKGV